MKDFDTMTNEEKQEYINELYNSFTPENKEKARAFYLKLLAEQEAESKKMEELYNGMEVLNNLMDSENNQIMILKSPEKEQYYIYLNEKLFATFDNEISAVTIADMMQLHIKEYKHLLN